MAIWHFTLTFTWPDGSQVTLLPEGYWTRAPDCATEDDVKQQLLARFLAMDPDTTASATITNFRATRRS